MRFLLDDIMDLARYLRVDWRKDNEILPPWLGYRCSLAFYILSEIETKLGITRAGRNLYERLEAAKVEAFSQRDAELSEGMGG